MKPQDVQLILVEEYPCDNVYQAKVRERWWIEQDGQFNHEIPNRTDNEYYEANKSKISARQKEYYKVNKATIDEWNKQYYEKTKEQFNKRVQDYQKANPEKRLEWSRNFENNNKEKRLARHRESVECNVRGEEMSKGSLKRHIKRKHTT
jgi:transketolase